MASFLQIFNGLVQIAVYVIIAQAILSWLVAFNVVNLHQSFVRQIWSGLNTLTEPLYRPVRNLLPDMGGIDLSPIVVLFGLFALQTIINNNLQPYAYGY